MKALAVIVAGGRSSRMGREKALEVIRGRTIIARVISLLGAQGLETVINANGDVARFAETGLKVIGDLRADIQTPLAGLHTALSFAEERGFDAVLTVPSDAPFLPADLFRKLAEAGGAAIAASGGQAHYLTGLWPVSLLADLERALGAGRLPRMQDWAKMCGAALVAWPAVPYDPFFNVNTPEELAEAERIAAEFDL